MKISVTSRLEESFYKKVKAEARRRDIFVSRLVSDALESELDLTDFRLEIQKLERILLATQGLRDVYKKDAADLRKKVASLEARVLGLVKGRDLFKLKNEKLSADLNHAEDQIEAYESQGRISRFFKRKPRLV